jgi:6-phosphogluconolactonase (cycloisomerase 2 family)
MATVVPSQFLFTADPSTNSLIGFKINSDGGLSLIPGSPFRISDTPHQLSATGSTLIVKGDKGVSLLSVNRESGAIATGSVQVFLDWTAAQTTNQPEILDASGRFFYAIDPARSEIKAFEMRNGQSVPLSPGAYRTPAGATSLILVRP